MRVLYDIDKNHYDRSDPLACLYQVIRIKTSNKFSEIYFLRLQLVYG